MITPGPGQYQAKTIASEMRHKVTSKSGVFGSTQRRFVANSSKEALPGPGQYTKDLVNKPPSKTQAQKMKALPPKANSMLAGKMKQPNQAHH